MPDAAKCEKALELITLGNGVRAAARMTGVAHMTLVDWLKSPEYAVQYAHAREAGWHAMAESVIEIADDPTNDTQVDDEGNEKVNHDHIQRSRLRVDARRWLVSKMLPKVYGDKLTTENTTTHKFDGAKESLAAKINRAFDGGTESEAG